MLQTVLNDRYRIVSELGEGGMATVYLAIDSTLNREVAVKILHPHLAKDKDLSARFYQEAAIAAGLDHPNVMKIFDYGRHSDGRAYIVAEFLEGSNFYELQNNYFSRAGRSLPALFCALVVAEVLKGLSYAHRKNVIHRDIKPDNVMVTESGMVKLMDFGIAKNTAKQLTLTGHFLGSPSYSSPEQIRGNELDGRTDLYSVGVILYESLTNRPPFSGLSAPEVMLKICEGSYAKLSQFAGRIVNGVETIPHELADITDKAMSLEASQRYRTAEAMLEHLKIFVAAYGVAETSVAIRDFLDDSSEFEKKYTRERPARLLVSSDTHIYPTRKPKLSRVTIKSKYGERQNPGQAALLRPAAQDFRDPKEIAEEMRLQREKLSATQRRERNIPPHRQMHRTQRRHKLFAISHPGSRTVARKQYSFAPRLVYGVSGEASGWGQAVFWLVVAASLLLGFYLVGKIPRQAESPEQLKKNNRIAADRNRDNEKITYKSPSKTPGVRGREVNKSAEDKENPTLKSNRPEVKPSGQGVEPLIQKEILILEDKKRQESLKPRSVVTDRSESKVTEKLDKPNKRGKVTKVSPSAPLAVPTPETRAGEEKIKSPENKGILTLQTVPGGVPIYLNKKYVGQSDPLGRPMSLSYASGAYLLQIPRVTIGGTRFLEHAQRVFIENNGKSTSLGVIRLRALRRLSIFISGPGVIVRVNKDPYVIKNRPLVFNLPEGQVDIEAKATNGKQFRRSIELKGEDLSINTSLD